MSLFSGDLKIESGLLMFKQHLAYRTYKNYCNDETNIYVYRIDYEISKIANNITKIPRTVKIV